VVGARMTKDRMTALRYPNDDVAIVTRLVRLHLRFHGYGTGTGWTDAAVRRFVRDAGDQLDRLIELTRCDCTTRNQRKAEMLARRMDHLVERITALEAEEHVKSIRPDLDGRQVMDHLGLAPGREVGQALDMLLELRLDEGPLSTEEAFARLDQWWAERGD
jgi:poly(A) polymerase